MLGTVSYNLEHGGGGHYLTRLFGSPSLVAAATSSQPMSKAAQRNVKFDSVLDHCVRIHKDEMTAGKRRPDFDVETVIIAMRRMQGTVRATDSNKYLLSLSLSLILPSSIDISVGIFQLETPTIKQASLKFYY